MAVRQRLLLLLGLLAAMLGLRSAQGAGRERYQLKDPSCPIKVYVAKTWQATEGVWSEGTWVLGAPAPSKAELLYLFHQGRTYASPLRCWVRESGETPRPAAVQSVGFSYLNWQETLALQNTSTGQSYPLRANQSGWGLAYSRELKAWRRLRLSMTGIFFTAASTVLTSSRDAAALGALSYRSVDASALGGMLMPELDWVRGGDGSSLGISLPVSFRITNWASPEGYQVSNTQRLLYGPLLTARLNRPGWEFVSRLGFLSSSQNLAWILSVGRVL